MCTYASNQPASRAPYTGDQPRQGTLAQYWRAMRESLTGYFFIAPAVMLIALFGLFPIGYAAYMSLYEWDINDPCHERLWRQR
jgi:hypothetical protein